MACGVVGIAFISAIVEFLCFLHQRRNGDHWAVAQQQQQQQKSSSHMTDGESLKARSIAGRVHLNPTAKSRLF